MLSIFRRSVARTALGALLIALLAACAASPTAQTPTNPPAATTAPAAATIPAADSVPTSERTSASMPATTGAPTSAASSAAIEAIKTAIQRANQEQQDAIAAHDPTPMRATATAAYYSTAAQSLNDLMSAGVTAIQLVNVEWGPITLQGTAAAQATTVETWSTTFTDGSTLQQTDKNIYTLVLENNAWKVQDDQHPDAGGQQPAQDTSGAAPVPAAPVPAAPDAPGAADQSRNWAGYTATGGSFTAVAGTWTVPTVSAGRTPAADATWVGIGGVSSHDLIQAGTDASVQAGQVQYTAWVELLPQASQPVPLEVSAGDTVSVTITQQPDQRWQIRIQNTTTGQSYAKIVTYQSSRSSAEWIEEAPAVGRRTLLPLDNFGTITFTGATAVADGQQRTITQASGQAITMSNATGQALAQPSALGSDGTSFSVRRTDVTIPQIAPRNRSVPSQTLSN